MTVFGFLSAILRSISVAAMPLGNLDALIRIRIDGMRSRTCLRCALRIVQLRTRVGERALQLGEQEIVVLVRLDAEAVAGEEEHHHVAGLTVLRKASNSLSKASLVRTSVTILMFFLSKPASRDPSRSSLASFTERVSGLI